VGRRAARARLGGLWQMVVFLGILGVAFVYEIGRGGLEWD
jgi:NADH:ubiquinone oxidoreductase subunit 3 (subunit A)